MDLNLLLLWTALASVVALLPAVVQGGAQRRSWAVVAALLAVVAGVGWLLAPESAGFVAGAVWAALVLAPGLLLQSLSLAMQRQEYAKARRLSALLAVLHPSRDMREDRVFVRALERSQRGDVDGARALLAPRASEATPAGRRARVQLFRLEADWAGLAAYGAGVLQVADFTADPSLAAAWLRALGETGDRAGLVASHERFEPLFERPGLQVPRDLARLYLFAFTGRVTETEQLLASRLPAMGAGLREYWRATAELAAGRADAAGGRLARLAHDPDSTLRRAAAARAAGGPFESAPVPGESGVLARAERLLGDELRFGEPAAGASTRAPLTRVFAALIVLGFAAEVALGGSEDPETLLRLGAFWPPWVLAGEWWRLVAYQFLHFGPLHLVMNLLALMLLGRGVERALGGARQALVYAVSGTAGGALALLSTALGWREPQLLVGASGGVMGLVGATLAIALRGHLRERSAVARRRLGGVLAIVVLQSAFDLATPQVSLFAHATGLVTGFLLTSQLRHRGAEPALRRGDAVAA
jgi:rhomboid protease GluP